MNAPAPIEQYLHKGSQVYIEGQLRTRKWQDQSGQDRYTTEVTVNVGGTMQMLGGKQDGGQQPQRSGSQQPQQQQQSSNNEWGQPKMPAQQRQTPQQPDNEPTMNFDEDIPF